MGYTPTVKQSLMDRISEKQIGREVVGLANGEEMLVRVIDRLRENRRNGVSDLVITDVPMPFLNGINAAIGLRAIEKTYMNHDLMPILFLTNKPCDETFKKVIKYLAPAKYATLGPVDDPPKLNSHIAKIISLIAKETW